MAEMKNYTQAGYDALQKELDFLKNVRREEVKNEVAKARSYGDLSENSEYDEAKNEEAKVEMRIHELEEMISLAHVIDESEIDHTRVSVGAIVEVENAETKVKDTYHIVGSYEADPLEGKISDQSAIGAGLLGAQAGNKVSIDLPNGKTLILNVLSVSRAKL